jgi:hypothetical protein
MKTFHVHYEAGETSSGDSISRTARVTFEDDGIWPENEIIEIKECLANIYGCTPKEVRTESEEAQDAIDLERYLDEESKKLNQ